MLYTLHDMKQGVLEPMMLGAKTSRQIFNHPANPWAWTLQARMMNAGMDVMESLSKSRGKPEWDLNKITHDGKEYAVEQTVVDHKAFCELRKFSLKRDAAAKQPAARKQIFVLAPMSGHFSTLLRDTIKRLLVDADVFITDWFDAKHVPLDQGRFGVEEYILYIQAFLETIGPHQDGKDGGCHGIAVCQPAPLLLAATALMAANNSPYTPRTITLMGGPVDASAAPTLVTQLAENRPISWFEHHNVHHVPARYEGAGRRVYPGFLQLRAFWSMNPARHNMAHWNMFKHLIKGNDDSAERTQDFYNEYMAVLDVTAEFYLETVHHIFKKHSLRDGTMTVGDQKIDLAAIEKVGILTVEGELDDISAPGQTMAAHALCPNVKSDYKKNILVEKAGHYGIFNGRKWRDHVAPAIIDFMGMMDQEFNAAPKKA
ncbi:MAG: polyhydroxyalkanoate depolymerase [Alphaproteobacteria bacterium]